MKPLLIARLAQFGLRVADDKTHQTNLGSRSDAKALVRRRMMFLGFTIYRAKNRSGTASKTVFETESKRLSRAKSAVREKLKRTRHRPIEAQAKVINAMLRGHIQYYGIAGNGKRVARFWNFVRRDWRHWLSKRSQKGRVTWEKFLELEKIHPLVAPSVRISYSKLESYARL